MWFQPHAAGLRKRFPHRFAAICRSVAIEAHLHVAEFVSRFFSPLDSNFARHLRPSHSPAIGLTPYSLQSHSGFGQSDWNRPSRPTRRPPSTVNKPSQSSIETVDPQSVSPSLQKRVHQPNVPFPSRVISRVRSTLYGADAPAFVLHRAYATGTNSTPRRQLDRHAIQQPRVSSNVSASSRRLCSKPNGRHCPAKETGRSDSPRAGGQRLIGKPTAGVFWPHTRVRPPQGAREGFLCKSDQLQRPPITPIRGLPRLTERLTNNSQLRVSRWAKRVEDDLIRSGACVGFNKRRTQKKGGKKASALPRGGPRMYTSSRTIVRHVGWLEHRRRFVYFQRTGWHCRPLVYPVRTGFFGVIFAFDLPHFDFADPRSQCGATRFFREETIKNS